MKKLASDDPERVARILCDRERTIGVDTHALYNQVMEKHQRLEEEARERQKADEAWSARWRLVEEKEAQRQAAYQARMIAYRTELSEQIEAKRRAAGPDNGMATGPGFMDGFEKSHR